MVVVGRSVFEEACAAIKRKTRSECDIKNNPTVDHIGGQDPISHITIMYRIEVLLGVRIYMDDTNEASTIRVTNG